MRTAGPMAAKRMMSALAAVVAGLVPGGGAALVASGTYPANVVGR